jgi:hypothetical protein
MQYLPQDQQLPDSKVSCDRAASVTDAFNAVVMTGDVVMSSKGRR